MTTVQLVCVATGDVKFYDIDSDFFAKLPPQIEFNTYLGNAVNSRQQVLCNMIMNKIHKLTSVSKFSAATEWYTRIYSEVLLTAKPDGDESSIYLPLLWERNPPVLLKEYKKPSLVLFYS